MQFLLLKNFAWVSMQYSFKCNTASNVINKFERRMGGKGAVKVGKRFTLFSLNEDMDDSFKVLKSLGDSGVLIDEAVVVLIYWKSKKYNKRRRRLVSWYFVSTVNYFSGRTSDFFCGRRYYWKRNHDSKKKILW